MYETGNGWCRVPLAGMSGERKRGVKGGRGEGRGRERDEGEGVGEEGNEEGEEGGI